MSRASHVVPQGEKWVVIRDGNSRPSSVHETKSEAVDTARRLARKERSQVFIHGRDGRIRDHMNFGEVRADDLRWKSSVGRDRIREAVWNVSKGATSKAR